MEICHAILVVYFRRKVNMRHLSHFFPKNHPVDSKMRPVVATGLRMARKTMPLLAFEYPARKRNELARDCAGEVILKIMRREARKFGIEE